MALLCIYATSFGQSIKIEPYYIGDRVPDIPLYKIVNYKDTTATLSSFGHKLIILDFWGTHCGSCIKMFPAEDSLQQQFKDNVQFILVTSDDSTEVSDFLIRYNKTHVKLSLPIVTSDILISQMFRHTFVPHYVWLAPDGGLLAQTLATMINTETLLSVISGIRQREEDLRSDHYPETYFHFPALNSAQSTFFHQYRN